MKTGFRKTILLQAGILIFAALSAQNVSVVWHNPMDCRDMHAVHNQGWDEDGGNYMRLPLRAKPLVREKLWNLSCESAGLALVFETDADEIYIRYHVSGDFSMPHMPATGVSGVDLYRMADDGSYDFCFGSYEFGETVRYSYRTDNRTVGECGYTLYLPLYNKVLWLEVGVPEGSVFRFIPADTRRPIVVYGTSIAQGACASRPGMAWCNILGRMLGVPVVNLGFSGNGKLENELIGLMNELDAQAYVLDCIPNLTEIPADELAGLLKNAVMRIRECHPDTPVLLVEQAGYSNRKTSADHAFRLARANEALEKAFMELAADGVRNIYRLSADELGFGPDSWVDYVHPSDLGMMRQAEAVAGVLGLIMKNEQKIAACIE